MQESGREHRDGESLGGATVVILAGGPGTRLRPAVPGVPKVLAPVAGRPFLCWMLDRLAAAHAGRIVLCTGHGADAVERTLGRRHADVELVYSREDRPLGTAGALRAALDHVHDPDFLALNGDTFCGADLGAFRSWCHRRRPVAALAAVRVAQCARFGRVGLKGDGVVAEFEEKGVAEGPGWINAGVYWFPRALVQGWPRRVPLSLEREVLPGLVGHGLAAWPGEGAFVDIGTPESYRTAAAALCGTGAS